MCFFANFWGDFVIVNAFSVLLFCEYLFADGRNDAWSSWGEWNELWCLVESRFDFNLNCLTDIRNDRFDFMESLSLVLLDVSPSSKRSFYLFS